MPHGERLPDEGPERDDKEDEGKYGSTEAPARDCWGEQGVMHEDVPHMAAAYHRRVRGIDEPMRHLGIDFGTHTIGLSLSDEAGTMGFPHGTLPNDGELIPTLTALIQKEGVGRVVIGESRDLSGKENPVAAEARRLGDALAATGVPVSYEAEFFSTQEARRLPDGTRGNGRVDAPAAALILTSYLSRSHD